MLWAGLIFFTIGYIGMLCTVLTLRGKLRRTMLRVQQLEDTDYSWRNEISSSAVTRTVERTLEPRFRKLEDRVADVEHDMIAVQPIKIGDK